MLNFSRRRRAKNRNGRVAAIAMKMLKANCVLFSAASLFMPLQAAHAANNPTVQTAKGGVQGFINNNVAEFLGIPYAKPPVGNLRWMPPKAPAAWKKTLKAQAYAPTCAQITTLGVFAGPANNNEDCLYLNVFTPDLNTSAKLPVIFWIHGGGNVDGESNDYDGSKMASQGHVVVVTINYRLNLFGFLAVPSLDSEGHPFGNYGILDQQFALKWVHQNIAKFGGDPNNITVGGQSAGAQDSGLNVISPLAAGTFQKAIFESSTPTFIHTLAQAETIGTNFAVAAGCGKKNGAAQAKCLRNLTAAQVEALAGTASTQSAYITGPLQDGTIITEQPYDAWTSGNFQHMPIMTGDVHDEENFTLAIQEYFTKPHTPLTEAQYATFVQSTYSGNAGPEGTAPAYPAGTAAKVLAKYPVSAYGSAQLAWDAVGTDPGACRELYTDKILYKEVPLYAYEFDDRTAPFYFPKLPGFEALAYHTSDIQYLFPLYHGGQGTPHPLNAKQANLSDQLVAAWTNFAWNGNPNGTGNTPWPKYSGGANKADILSENIPALTTYTAKQYSALHNCTFWNKILVY